MRYSRAVSIPLVLVAALATTLAMAGDEAAAVPLPVRLTLEDGSTVDVLGPIRVRDGKVLFRLAGGRLASLPVSRVRAVAPLPAPSPAEPGPDSGQEWLTAEPPETERFTNEDLPPPLDTSRSIVPPDRPSEAPADSPAPEVGYEDYRDREGRGEDWWRERVAGLDRDLAEARKEMEEAYAELHSLTREYGMTYTGGRALQAIRKVRERFERAEERWRRLAAERASLEDEARRAGALPGWLR